MRTATASAIAAGAGVARRCGPALAPHVPPLADRLGIARRLKRDGVVALTFDDGPHAKGTPAVLELLRARRATATFFVVGEQLRRNPSLIGEIAAAGHAVAVHGDRHRALITRSARAVGEDLDRVTAELGDHAIAVHRPPYGVYTVPALRAVRARGLAPLLWSRWGRDWRAHATAADVAETVARGLSGGDVLLLHDADDYGAPGCWRTTVAALPRVLDAIDAAGLRTVAVSATALRPAAGGSTAARTSGDRLPSR